jgi:hypothetical protein
MEVRDEKVVTKDFLSGKNYACDFERCCMLLSRSMPGSSHVVL